METKEHTMERQAAVAANKIYAYWATLTYEQRREALSKVLYALDTIAPHLSTTAYNKYLDFTGGVRHNY